MYDDDPYWDDLGIAWRAAEPELEQLTPRLQARLRRQSLAITSAITIGLPLCCAGVALGAFTLWLGWTSATWNFVTRGIAIVLISAMLIRALVSLLPVRTHANSRSLSEMLGIATARIRRTRFLIRTAIAAGVIAAAFGIAGAVIRIRAGSPPHLSPIVDLIIIALVILCLWMLGRRVAAEGRKLDYLRRSLGSNE